MCFNNDDGDWIVGTQETSTVVVEKPTRCRECASVIPYGAEAIAIALYEFDDSGPGCITCDNGDCECTGNCCQCDEPNRGEEYHTVRCLNCNAFLNAVQIAEEEAGCRHDESRPPLDQMQEYIREAGIEEADKYRKVAIREYPWLRDSGYLSWLWSQMFAD